MNDAPPKDNKSILVITRTYTPGDLPEVENQFVLRERMTRNVIDYRSDILARGEIEDAYADALREIERSHEQVRILRKALKVAAAIIRLVWLKDSKAQKFIALCWPLAQIANNSRHGDSFWQCDIDKAFVKLCPADVTGRDEWNMLRSGIAPRIYKRDKHACVYCGSRFRLSIDHINPVSRGGKHDDDNLVTCCRSCNSSKGDRTLEEWNEIRQSQADKRVIY